MQYSIHVAQHIIIPESEHAEAFRSKVCITTVVVRRVTMLPAIHFNNQSCIQTCEVGYIWSNRVLAAEFETKNLTLPDAIPKRLLGIGHFFSQASGYIELRIITHLH